MMSNPGKKDKTRFTIRFNSVDPRHQIAMEALDAAGRRKASFIADAVCEYLARYSGDRTTALLTNTGQAITYEPVYSSGKTTTTAPLPESILQNVEVTFNEADTGFSEDDSINDNMRNAILGGLNMFNVQADAI